MISAPDPKRTVVESSYQDATLLKNMILIGALFASAPMLLLPLAVASTNWVECAGLVLTSAIVLVTTYALIRIRSRARHVVGSLVFVWAALSAYMVLAHSMPVLLGTREFSEATRAGL